MLERYTQPKYPRLTDAFLVLVTFLINMLMMMKTYQTELESHEVPLGFLLPIPVFLLASLSLFQRRQHPVTVMVIILAAMIVMRLMGLEDGPVATMVAIYSLGRYLMDDLWSITLMACTTALVWLDDFMTLAMTGSTKLDSFLGEFLILFLLWSFGRRVRARILYMTLLKERGDQLEREQQAEADRAVASERARIARELHDIVAHQVSMMTVQAGAAKTVARSDMEAAVKAMEAVEGAGRQALREMRQLLSLLRPEQDSTKLAPQPGPEDIPDMVSRLRQAGMNISLDIQELPDNLPKPVGLACYRIAQEALTNVLKHAGSNPKVQVRLEQQEGWIHLSIRDNGRGGPPSGGGYGIRGMRERAQLLGGRFTAAPAENGGFDVHAELPLEQEETS